MKTGDVVFVRGTSLLSKLISWFDRGEFSHVAIVVSNEGEVLEAEYTTKVRKVPFTYKSYKVVNLHLTAEEALIVSSLVPLFEGKRYDFFHALLLWIKMVFGFSTGKFNSPKKLICTELVAYILIQLGKGGEEMLHLTPNELYDYLVKLDKQGQE
jgi:hypothetical protein